MHLGILSTMMNHQKSTEERFPFDVENQDKVPVPSPSLPK